MRFGCVVQRERPVQNRSDSALANLLQTPLKVGLVAGHRPPKLLLGEEKVPNVESDFRASGEAEGDDDTGRNTQR